MMKEQFSAATVLMEHASKSTASATFMIMFNSVGIQTKQVITGSAGELSGLLMYWSTLLEHVVLAWSYPKFSWVWDQVYTEE
jgi:hypothetical protein